MLPVRILHIHHSLKQIFAIICHANSFFSILVLGSAPIGICLLGLFFVKAKLNFYGDTSKTGGR